MMPSDQAGVAGLKRLLIVEDHELVCLGLRTLIASYAREAGQAIEILEARTLDQGVAQYHQAGGKIALVLLDLHLPDAHGLSGLRQFLARCPGAPIAVLSGNSDPALKREATNSGARVYLTKSGQPTEVIAYLQGQGLLGGGSEAGVQTVAHAPAPLAGDTFTPARTVDTLDGQRIRLTLRQSEVLDAVLAGRSNREIAELVYLSEGTVKNHVSTLLLMFGVRSRSALISRLR